jgi:DNA-3-methyladenine glycosylase II
MTSIPATQHQPASEFLSRIDTDWSQLIAHVGACTLTADQRSPYSALIRAIAYQQLHPKAGDAILGRFLALHADAFPTPEQLLTTSPEVMRACGFSASKVAAIHGIAQARLDGVIPDLETAANMKDEALITQLTTLKGIGRWTVEMMLIFTLGRTDILPADDFGVREGYKRLKKLQVAPTKKELQHIGEHWRPYRSIASWYLWRVPR